MFANFSIFTPQPGTKIFDNYKNKMLDLDYEDYTYLNMVMRIKLETQDVFQFTSGF